MAVTRNIEDFEVAEVYGSGWSNEVSITVTDLVSLEVANVNLTISEAKQFAKELKAAIKELEGK